MLFLRSRGVKLAVSFIRARVSLATAPAARLRATNSRRSWLIVKLA